MPVQLSPMHGYRLWAKTWESDPSAIVALESRWLSPWLGDLRGKVVLDLSCGVGRWLTHAKSQGAIVFGMDLCPEMLIEAAKKPGLAGRLALADTRHLPVADGRADVVICALSLGHMSPVESAMAELVRMVASGGSLIVSDFHPDAGQRGWKRTFRNNGELYEIDTHPYSKEQLIRCALRGGLVLQGLREPCFDEPEREIFHRAHKDELFDQVRRPPSRPAGTLDAAMILRGARVAVSAAESAELDIEIGGGAILAIRKSEKRPKGVMTLDLGGHLVMPGLINAHDHLEFNLYPRLGRGPYPNAGAWARDIYRPCESPVKEQLQVPKSTRLFWGGVKNLLSGVTTVCHHNPCDHAVFERNFPVRVIKQFGWAHSLEFSRDVAECFHATPPDWPFILHLGEGTDREARNEIYRLDELRALDQRTILVHAVSLDRKGLSLVKERGASVIWCPSSNLFLLERTLNGQALDSGVQVTLGSDSALTGKGDLLDEMKLARKVSGLSSRAIYDMVTVAAAKILRLQNGAGTLAAGAVADVVAFHDASRSPAVAVARAKGPALVIVGGKVKLMSAALVSKWRPTGMHRLDVEGRGEFFVAANIPKWRASAERALGVGLRLAGRRIMA